MSRSVTLLADCIEYMALSSELDMRVITSMISCVEVGAKRHRLVFFCRPLLSDGAAYRPPIHPFHWALSVFLVGWFFL